MMNYWILLKTIPFAFFFTNFSPLQDWLNKYVKSKLKSEYIKTALSCWKCISFWSTFVAQLFIELNFDSFLLACTASILVWTYEKIINSLKTYL